MAPKGPQQPAQPYYAQGTPAYGHPGQANAYMPGASYMPGPIDPYAQQSMPDPYAMGNPQVSSSPPRPSLVTMPLARPYSKLQTRLRAG